MIKRLIIFAGLFLLLNLLIAGRVWAASCASVPISGNYTLSSSCNFANTVDGVDSGSGSTNTASITLTSSATLTISAQQTVAFGSLTKVSGTIVIVKSPAGAQIVKSPIWMTDADADGYASSTTQIAQNSQPANGRRRNLMNSVSSTDCDSTSANVYQNVGSTATDADQDGYYTGSSGTNCVGASTTVSGRTYYKATSGSDTWLASGGALGTSDCSDSDATLAPSRTWYTDADGDLYTLTGGSGECQTISTWGNSACTTGGSSYAKNSTSTCRLITSSGTDCYDSNANAYPGQTTYFTTDRGDGSFDYNCSSGTLTADPTYTNYCVSGVQVSENWYDQSNCTVSISGLLRNLAGLAAIAGNESTACGREACETKYYCSDPEQEGCGCSADTHVIGPKIGCR